MLGIVLGVGAFSFLSMQALGRSTDTMLQERLTFARLVADYADRMLSQALGELQNTARSISPEADIAALEPQVEQLIQRYAQLGLPVASFFLLDEAGEVLYPPSGAGGVDFFQYSGVQRTLQTGEPGVSSLVSAPLTQAPAVLLSSPVGQGGGQGILVIAIDAAQWSLASLIQPIKLGETGYAEIVDEEGKVLARTEPGNPPIFFEKSDHPERFAALIQARKPTVGTCHRCHLPEQSAPRRKDVLAFAPLEQASWGVVIRQAEEEALAPTRELQWRLFTAGALILAISLGMVWFITSDIVSRIRMLKKASLRMAGGDLTTSIPSCGKDEIGTLAQTLDDTRLKLKASYQEIEQRTKELASLLAVSKTFTSTTDLSTLLDAVVAKVMEVIEGADAGALLLYQAEEKGFVIHSVVGLDIPSLSGKTLPSPPEGAVYESAYPMSEESPEKLQRLAEESYTTFLQLVPVKPPPQSVIYAPLISKKRCVGSIILMSFRDANAFTPSHIHLLQAIANDVAMVVENIELSKEAEEARVLRETDRLKSQFISAVSHELRTPLTSIKGYSTSLLRQDVSWDEETKREFLQAIDEKADELQDLIDKLLQTAKVEAGSIKINKEPVLVSHLAQEVVAEASSRDGKHQLEVDFPSPFPVIEGDAHYLRVILRNLIDNAIKYSPAGGKIRVSGRRYADKILVSVSDQGIGIPVEHQQRIFDRFYRIENELTRRTSGSGLGLFIVRGLVEAHGGEVWVESTKGGGSTFFFTLPVERVETTES